jgi:pimeloyl-ACP methyl ester carboxylesterase
MSVTLSAHSATIPGTYWTWQNHLIYYVRAGVSHSQRPPLLLVHGFGASTDHWRKNIQELSQTFEVWAIDLLGFGRSAKPELQYSGRLWQEQLHEFIAQVIGQPTVVAGNSLGGYAALSTAAYYPDFVAGLILLNSAGPFSTTQLTPEPSRLQRTLGKTTKWLFQQDWVSFLIFQWTRRRSVIRNTLKKVYLDHSAITDQLVEEIYRPSCTPGAAKVFASIFRTPSGDKVDVLLNQLQCPLLMLWGEADPWINCHQRSAQFRQYYPQLTEHFLQAGHCPHDEVPQQVNTLIQEWVLGMGH